MNFPKFAGFEKSKVPNWRFKFGYEIKETKQKQALLVFKTSLLKQEISVKFVSSPWYFENIAKREHTIFVPPIKQ